MASSIFRINHSIPATELGATARISVLANQGRARECLTAIAALFSSLAANMEQGINTIDVALGGTTSSPATGTLTIASGSGAVGGTIAGVLKTVTWATSDTATAAALAAAINADATLKTLVFATSAAGVVTITSLSESAAASQITLVASGTGVTAGGLTSGKLTGGAGDDAVTVTLTR